MRMQHPCPLTGKTRGTCPGNVFHHVKPLCAGGWGNRSNMQWQTVAETREKDKVERHGDIGATLKAVAVLAILNWLGVKPSYSRSRVSDDNAYAE